MRGGADGVGPSTPQLIPATIFRKNFEFIAKIKPHEVPNRPELYMLGSCVTQNFLNGLTIGATCTHEDYREPCFTTEEIAEATTQLNVEKATYSEFTAEEIAEHTAQGGCAPPQPGIFAVDPAHSVGEHCIYNNYVTPLVQSEWILYAKRVSGTSIAAQCVDATSADAGCGEYMLFKVGECWCVRSSYHPVLTSAQGPTTCSTVITTAGPYQIYKRSAEDATSVDSSGNYVPTVDIASCTANNQQNEFRPDRDT
jgi:hypothetical protein